MSKGKWLLLLVYLSMGSRSFAQRYSIVSYTPKNGLINSRVRSMYQDSKGFLYFLTYAGLSRYDGQRFLNFNKADGLASNDVNDIFEAGPDSFLIATNTTRLNTLVNGRLGKWSAGSDPCPTINHFFKSSTGDLYLAADEGLYQLKGQHFLHLPLFPAVSPYKGIWLNDIIEYDRYLLISTWGDHQKENLICYDTVLHMTTDVFTDGKPLSMALRGRDLWIGTERGIYTLDPVQLRKGKIKPVLNPLKYTAGHHHIAFDKEGNVWLHDNKSLVMMTPGGKVQSIGSQQGLSATNIGSLFFDREGTLWLTTDGSGILKIVSTDISILDNGARSVAYLQCSGATTWMLYNDHKTVGRYMGGILKKFEMGMPTQARRLIVSGKHIYFSDAHNFYMVDDKNAPLAWRHMHNIYQLKDPSMQLGKGIIDAGGNIHFGIYGDSTFYIVSLHPNRPPSFFKTSQITDEFVLDKAGRLWAITRSNSLMVFQISVAGASPVLRLLHDYSSELPDLQPRSLAMDSVGNICIGTREKGLYFIEMDSLRIKAIHQLTTKDGLTDNFVYSLAYDKNGHYWAGTQSGLDKLTCSHGHCIVDNISRNDNLFETVLRVNVAAGNTIWALCIQGEILTVNTTRRQPQRTPPQLLLTGLSINGLPAVDTTPARIFTHKQNSLSFSIAATSFMDERSIFYSYRLEGSGNDKWSPPSNTADLNFLNLEPGKYTLHVRAGFPAIRYPDQYMDWSFRIDPPFWQTWPFRGLALLLLAALVTILIRIYVDRRLEKQRQLLERQQAIEKERTRIATDMHDDLGAGLTRIKFISENIAGETTDTSVRPDLEKLVYGANELVGKMGEIIWAMNEKNNTLEDLVFYLRAYAVEYCMEHGLQCDFHLPPTLPDHLVNGQLRRNIFLVVKECLHNIVKHAHASQVNIRIYTDSMLVLQVSDDGQGFTPFASATGNGLLSMQQRARTMKGHLTIRHDAGTIVRMEIPL